MAAESLRWIVWLFLAGCGLAYGSAAPVPALDPTDYQSPSGRFSLHVEPTERHGAGPARYSQQRGEETVWAGELPFTLQKAVVDDLGRVAGYGYSKGSAIQFDPGDFLLAVIAADGTASALERTPRVESRYLHAHADPKAATLFLHAELERVVIRVADPDFNRAQERWWVHALDDGRRLAIWEPSPKLLSPGGKAWVLDALTACSGWTRMAGSSACTVRRPPAGA